MTWSMSSWAPRRTSPPQLVRGRIVIEGHQWTHPTKRRYWHEGEYWRVQDGADQPLLIIGPRGTFWDFGPDGPLWAQPAQPVLYRHPVQEVVALASLDALSDWLDLEITKSPLGFGTTRFQARSAERHITGFADRTTGTVLTFRLIDEHGGLTLRTEEFEITPSPSSMFEYDGPTRRYTAS